MKEKISKNKIKHIADLSHLKINDQEMDSYKKDLNSILEYVSRLNELDTDNIPPMQGLPARVNVWQEDKPDKSNNTEFILKNAPDKENSYFKVPKIKEN